MAKSTKTKGKSATKSPIKSAKTAKRPSTNEPNLAEKPRKGKGLAKSLVKGKPTSIVPSQADPLLQSYLREVTKYPLMTREEEHETAVKFYETKDRAALQKLITSNLRFVVKIAYEYIHYRVKLLDLIQEGNMGLLKAVQEFDPYKEVRLTTYAVWWIRSYIQDAILRNYSLVKMGTTQAQKKLFYRLRAEQNRLERMGMAPKQNVPLLASRLEVREKDVQEMDSRLNQNDLSLNAPMSADDKKEHLSSLADPSAPLDESLGEAEQREIFSKILKEFAATLDGREKLVFNERLISEDPLTLQEIGDKYGVTKERARQIEEALKEKLKQFVKDKFPDYDLLARSL